MTNQKIFFLKYFRMPFVIVVFSPQIKRRP